MVKINQEHIDKYRKLYIEKYGKDIDSMKARDQLTSLVGLLDTVHRHMEQNNWPDMSGWPISQQQYGHNEQN